MNIPTCYWNLNIWTCHFLPYVWPLEVSMTRYQKHEWALRKLTPRQSILICVPWTGHLQLPFSESIQWRTCTEWSQRLRLWKRFMILTLRVTWAMSLSWSFVNCLAICGCVFTGIPFKSHAVSSFNWTFKVILRHLYIASHLQNILMNPSRNPSSTNTQFKTEVCWWWRYYESLSILSWSNQSQKEILLTGQSEGFYC